MKYELAKQLKDAGFPQRGDSKMLATKQGRKTLQNWGKLNAYAPTLEELIEACGPQLGCLLKRDKETDYGENFPPEWEWGASSKTFWNIQMFGSTPTEAVARLWLALNNK